MLSMRSWGWQLLLLLSLIVPADCWADYKGGEGEHRSKDGEAERRRPPSTKASLKSQQHWDRSRQAQEAED
jgi:hypothetical protein